MVYSGVVNRTQVYLSDEELLLLDRAEEASGASRSELIRRAIRQQYGDPGLADRRTKLLATAGAWKDWPTTGEEYVESVRRDLEARLQAHEPG